MLKPTAEITQLIPSISNNSGENPQMYRWVLRRRRRESVCVDFSWGWSHTEGGRGESILRTFEEATGKQCDELAYKYTHTQVCAHFTCGYVTWDDDTPYKVPQTNGRIQCQDPPKQHRPLSLVASQNLKVRPYYWDTIHSRHRTERNHAVLAVEGSSLRMSSLSI